MTVTDADREAAAAYWERSRIGNDETQRRYLSGRADDSFIVQAFARHRIAAEQAGARKMQEAAKQLVQKRMDERFEEYGIREPDTNATYYSGSYGETLEALDEEDEAIRDAIAAIDPAQIAGEKK